MANRAAPPYLQLKKKILDKVISGEWKAGHRVPSDNQLAALSGVSRLTANKAMRALADEGYLERVAGLGTFVAEYRSHGDFLRVTNIAEEIRNRRHEYDNQVVEKCEEPATEQICEALNLPAGTKVFHSIIVHRDQGIPIQLEDRYVNPRVAPDFLSVDLSITTPTAHLMEISPPHEVEQRIEAVMPTVEQRKLLRMRANEPCLVIKRRTWIRGAVATLASLYHPGSRYDVSGRWTP